jgi:hypothetical protein
MSDLSPYCAQKRMFAGRSRLTSTYKPSIGPHRVRALQNITLGHLTAGSAVTKRASGVSSGIFVHQITERETD